MYYCGNITAFLSPDPSGVLCTRKHSVKSEKILVFQTCLQEIMADFEKYSLLELNVEIEGVYWYH